MAKPISLEMARKKKKKYRCPDCPISYTAPSYLYDHVKKIHEDLIPDGVSVKQYVFNRRNNKTHGSCTICKKETKWNEELIRYERFCSDDCKKEARRRFMKNAKKRLGTSNPAADPEHQMKAIKGRGYSGEYKFKDGGVVGYSSSYELDFLKMLDEDMKFPSKEVEQCDIIFWIHFNGKKHFHIPDFYLPSFKLIVNIKTFENKNSNIQTTAKLRQQLSDKAIIDDGSYHYILILDKDYTSFINLIATLQEIDECDVDTGEKIICIPKY